MIFILMEELVSKLKELMASCSDMEKWNSF